MAIYILVTSFHSRCSGNDPCRRALFGLLVGTFTVSFASTIGATLACVVSRFILRDWVQSKFGNKLNAVNEGIEKEGHSICSPSDYPDLPFWLINLVMGLTRIPLRTFY